MPRNALNKYHTWAKPWNCDITAIFFKPCKHKINFFVRQITTLLKIFCMSLFILANINNIYSQRHLVVIFYYFFLQNDKYFQCWWKIIIWIILLSLRILGDHGKVCFDAMQRKQKNVLNVWFILRFKCRDVCNVAYITKKCNLFYYEKFSVNILNIFLLK